LTDDDRTLVERAQMDDGTTTTDNLIERYLGGTTLLRDAVAGMTPEQLAARPVAGKMSSTEVLCHVVDADQFMADRMKRTIATERPLLMGVESVDYLVPLRYADRDLDLDLRLLEVTREQMAADLRRLDPAAWERDAIHSEIGLVTLRGLLLHTIRHLERHVSAIEEKRAALGLG
jgi:uncharacterized damage-inducible protein DinB